MSRTRRVAFFPILMEGSRPQALSHSMVVRRGSLRGDKLVAGNNEVRRSWV